MDFPRKWGNKRDLLGNIKAGVGRLGSERLMGGWKREGWLWMAWDLNIYIKDMSKRFP